jgi:hypothetical protein
MNWKMLNNGRGVSGIEKIIKEVKLIKVEYMQM